MNKTIIEQVVKAQDELNSLIDKNWKEKENNWDRAIWVECAELVDSLDWQWWKSQPIDIENAKTEVIDIFHFLLSKSIEKVGEKTTVEIIYETLKELEFEEAMSLEEIRELIEYLVLESIYLNFNTDIYKDKMALLEGIVRQFISVFMLWELISKENAEQLFKKYFTKYALNIVRQKLGYKKGTYKKDWNGEEDNVVALRLAEAISFDENFVQALISALEEYYSLKVA